AGPGQPGRERPKRAAPPTPCPTPGGAKPSHFALTKNPAVTAKVEKDLAALEKLTADGKISKEVAEEGRRLLSRMPSLKSQQLLRRNFQSLVGGATAADEFLAARKKILDNSQIDKDEAATFAQKVYDAANKVQETYVKKLEMGEM